MSFSWGFCGKSGRREAPATTEAQADAAPHPVLQVGTEPPQFGEEDGIEHAAQIPHSLGSARAGFETDDALHRGHVTEAPLAERILQVDQFSAN